ncbi:MAG TPA: polysaccharide deacetylase family protein [Xanthobacteraceae bacterium]|nr:polysaccharide deacetylase family protein [Xanthobacteraceae bacterium]
MAAIRETILRAGLEALYVTGGHVWLRPLVGGVGVILTLHHVRPARADAFQPNRLLEVTPRFLEAAIRRVRLGGLEPVSLDEMHRRLVERDFRRRFVCFTFDDGYRDNLRFAYPILKQHNVPFAVYVPTSFPDRFGELWWLTLEAVIARVDRIGIVIDGRDRRIDCRTVEEKRDAYEAIYWWLRSLATEEEMRVAVRDLARRYGVDGAAFCQDLCMTWPELSQLAADPLVTIGAHTVNHVRLAKVTADAARREMQMGASVIEAALGRRPRHLSYPIGDSASAGPREFAIARELGFATAVTTRAGVLFPEHCVHALALPRISLNGEYQQPRYVRVLLSGAATAMWNGFRRVDAA